jgi:hypothetical protein
MDNIMQFVANLEEWHEVRVTWRDAHAPHSGWHEVEEYEPEDAVAVTIGRYWKNCQPHYLTTAGTVFKPEDGIIKTVGDINHIPLSWIIDIELIGKDNNGSI